ncbi:hypothetical protein LDL_059 [Lactobacillus phage Ldl1]|uniref:Uncharacterized protein n=1 Tax=Lactobacillus phage Ldl1 TaxID=1552735 RepID=A0A0A7DMM2_9CAUD|nr:hypothetical protein VC66_gp59 [Lactobacillus phage Ldl1]AIS73917.1 hypothetical protein LDL_059 [Lactobacillus phage Ldl1]
MTSREFVRRFNKLQERTCSKLVAEIQTDDLVYIYRIINEEKDLFAYSTYYGHWAFVPGEDRVLVTSKTLKLMAKYMKSLNKRLESK